MHREGNFSRRSFFAAAGIAAVGVALVGLTAPQTPAHAGKSEIYTGFLSGTGAGGYDVIAYRTHGKPVKGSKDFTVEWKGATWRFVSAENRDRFKASPTAYAPQYGGHCAWAVAQGYTAKGDPNHWNIVDGRLYLNFNGEIKQRWEQDIPGHIAAGDKNWPGVLDG